MKKRWVTLLLALALILVMCPIAPKAAAAETMSADVCPCCGKAFSSISWTSYSKLSNAVGAVNFSKAGHYKITGDFTMKKEFEVAANVTIDFNGLLLKAASGKRGFTVKSGGNLTLINRGGDNGRLAGQKTAADGGAIYVEEGGTLNILSGRVVGLTTSHKGGTIYNAGTVNIAGTGTVEAGKTSGEGGGNIYNAATGVLNIYDGTVKGGATTNSGYGGNICNLGIMNMYGGTVVGGQVNGDNGYGGNIYSSNKLTIKDGTVENGSSQDHGGNLFAGSGSTFHMHGGTISGGKATGYGSQFSGYGGNIYTTGAATDFKIYGGTITAGQDTANTSYGGNIMANGGVQIYMYGGTISYGVASTGSNVYVTSNATLPDSTKQYSAFYLLGGTVAGSQEKDLGKGAAANIIKMYNGRYDGKVDISAFVEDCCCCVPTATGYVMWNPGYEDGTCTDCLYAQAAAEKLPEESGGSHSYQLTGENTYTCQGCGAVRVLENVAATVDGELYESIEEAIAATESGKTLTLMADAEVDEAFIFGTLDLNGKTLTAGAFSSATTSGHVIDTSAKNTGKLVCDDVTVSDNNAYLPVNYEGSIRFCPVGFEQWVEPVDQDTTKVKFYITQRSHQTVMDDAIKAGNTELDVQIYLTWTDSQGVAQARTYAFGTELLQKYAEKWNGRVFVATITGTEGISNLTCTYKLVSTATSGATVSAKTIKSAGYINENLTWEQIESYPLKTSDMTVEEMRQLCVDFMEFTKTYLWTPSESVDFIKNASGTKDTMSQGTIYGGLPYVGVASGNPYRMMDYIDPVTGILDMKKALPALGTKDRLAMSDLKYFGSQCSESVYWGWGRVINSVNYKWTSSAVPRNGFVLLGDIQIDETIKNWTAAYNTDMACASNGEQVMYGAYAQCQKADGMVYYIEASDGDGAGHLVMVYSDAVVVKNDDGSINGDESYLTIIDQAQTWETATNASGDTYKRKNSVNYKRTFAQLYNSGYIPFTFAEFLGTDPIEDTEVSLMKDSTALVSGTVTEADRSFQASQTTDSLTWKDIFSSKITSNYGIVDAYIIVKDFQGNELYKHAVRTATAGNEALTLSETGEMVTTWVTKNLQSGKRYSAEIVVQLATGERPTIWTGELEYNK